MSEGAGVGGGGGDSAEVEVGGGRAGVSNGEGWGGSGVGAAVNSNVRYLRVSGSAVCLPGAPVPPLAFRCALCGAFNCVPLNDVGPFSRSTIAVLPEFVGCLLGVGVLRIAVVMRVL